MYWTGMMITSVLLTAYCSLILFYRQWFLRLPMFAPKPGLQPKNSFSIIIPARNEEQHIGSCLESVFGQNYPSDLFEVIVVNDFSSDKTEHIVNGFQQQNKNLQLVNLEDHLDAKPLNSYKKKAIELAISFSQGKWIVTTDADCTVTGSWLKFMDQYIQEQDPVFIAAPVMFYNRHSFLSTFQLLDFISLQGITAAAVSAGYHTMCNGANLAYRKDVFMEVGQFNGIDHIASGDDMLLMHKIKLRYPGRIRYLHHPNAIVMTEPMYTWKDFFNQRIRWASKADQYKDKSIFWALALVYLTNLALLFFLLAAPFINGALVNWLLLILVKTMVELSFMVPVARFYRQTAVLGWFLFMQPFHLFYTVGAGWLGKFGSYSWKGRGVK